MFTTLMSYTPLRMSRVKKLGKRRVDGICGSGQNGTVKNGGVDNAGVD